MTQLVSVVPSGDAQLIPTVYAELLCRCVQFKTVEDHARERWQEITAKKPGVISRALTCLMGDRLPPSLRATRDILEGMANHGLLVAEDGVLPPRMKAPGTRPRSRPSASSQGIARKACAAASTASSTPSGAFGDGSPRS